MFDQKCSEQSSRISTPRHASLARSAPPMMVRDEVARKRELFGSVSVTLLRAVKNAEYCHAFIAAVDLVDEDIGQPSHEPLACSRSTSWATRTRKITQNLRRLADAGADPRCGSGISAFDIFMDRQELRSCAGAESQPYRLKRCHTSSISASLAILSSRTSRFAISTSVTC